MKSTILRITAVVFTLFLLAGSSPAAEDIHEAVRSGDLARIKALIDKDPGLVDATSPNGQTPLFEAVMGRHPEIVEFLISKGADINARNNFHMTALHVGCRSGIPLSVIRSLVERGADVNSVAKYSGRPLDLAYESGDPGVIRYLASKGAGYTPLEFETFRLAGHIVRIAYPWGMRNNLLVSSGADGVLVVDTGFSKRSLEAIRKLVVDLGSGGVTYVINTHSDWDHVAGNGLAPSEEAVLGFQRLGDENLRGVLIQTEKSLNGRSGGTLPPPYTMRFNGEEIRLIPYPGLHSKNDILIHFTKSGVVCMGDLLLSQSCPAVGDVAGYLELLENVLDVFPEGTVFVSGHGRDLTSAGLGKYRDDMNGMIQIVKRGHADGKTPEDMIRADVLKAYKAEYSQLDWLGPDSWISRIVRSLQSGRLK